MNAKWSERGREIILKLIALPVPLLRQVSILGLVGLIFRRCFQAMLHMPFQVAPRRSQDAPKTPKRAPRAPKRPQDDAKTLPKRPHVGPLGPSKTIEKHRVFEGFSNIQPS